LNDSEEIEKYQVKSLRIKQILKLPDLKPKKNIKKPA